MTLTRCAAVFRHVDRAGRIEADIVAIYFGARASELEESATATCHAASPETRFGTPGLIERA